MSSLLHDKLILYGYLWPFVRDVVALVQPSYILSERCLRKDVSVTQFLAPLCQMAAKRFYCRVVSRPFVRLSLCPSVKMGGGGISQKRFSNFSSFLAWSFFGIT